MQPIGLPFRQKPWAILVNRKPEICPEFPGVRENYEVAPCCGILNPLSDKNVRPEAKDTYVLG